MTFKIWQRVKASQGFVAFHIFFKTTATILNTVSQKINLEKTL